MSSYLTRVLGVALFALLCWGWASDSRASFLLKEEGNYILTDEGFRIYTDLEGVDPSPDPGVGPNAGRTAAGVRQPAGPRTPAGPRQPRVATEYTVSFYILQENGDRILTEQGGVIGGGIIQ